VAQDVIVDMAQDAALNQAFSRQGQSDWAKSLKRVARAQAILWHETSLAKRQALLDQVDKEGQVK